MNRQILIENGRIVDPLKSQIDEAELLIENKRIIPCEKKDARVLTRIDASDCLIVPGLIDFHTHLFQGGSNISINPEALLPMGITSAVDAGTSGFANYRAFRKLIVGSSSLDIKSYLNVFGAGQIASNLVEVFDKKYYNPSEIKELFLSFPQELIGLKIRMSKGLAKNIQDLIDVIEIAEELDTTVCVHTTDPPCDIAEIADVLRPGDVFCHCYHGKGNTILDPNGKIKKSVLEARERGVIFDASNGKGNYSHYVCQKALEQNFYPDVISSDLTRDKMNLSPHAKSLTFIMSKYLALGMSLPDIIKAVTLTPARLMKNEKQLGTLNVETQADVTILKIIDHPAIHYDSNNGVYRSRQLIVPLMTIKSGEILYCAADFALWTE